MDVPLTWQIALGAAGALLLVTLLGIGTWAGRISAPRRALAQVGYLLAGGIIGFLSLAFAPAWPLLAFIAAMVVGLALRERRDDDVGLLLAGFGATWTLLLGTSILSDLADPAVHGSPGRIVWFLAGAGILAAGLITVVYSVVSAERSDP